MSDESTTQSAEQLDGIEARAKAIDLSLCYCRVSNRINKPLCPTHQAIASVIREAAEAARRAEREACAGIAENLWATTAGIGNKAHEANQVMCHLIATAIRERETDKG